MCNSPADLWTFKCGFESCLLRLKRKLKCCTFLIDRQYHNRRCQQVASVQQIKILSFCCYGLLANNVFELYAHNVENDWL